MTMGSQYGSCLAMWAMDNPDPTFIALIDDFRARGERGETIDVKELIAYEDPRFEYLDGCRGWGGQRFTKALKPEYRAAFDEWCLANAHGQFDHDKDPLYLSMSGYTDKDEGAMFITIDPKNHPLPV